MAATAVSSRAEVIGPFACRLDRVRWPGSRDAIARVEHRMLVSARKEIKAVEEYINFSMQRAAEKWRSSERVDDIQLVRQAEETMKKLQNRREEAISELQTLRDGIESSMLGHDGELDELRPMDPSSNSMRRLWRQISSTEALLAKLRRTVDAHRCRQFLPRIKGFRVALGGGSVFIGARMLWVEHVHGKIDLQVRPLFLRASGRPNRHETSASPTGSSSSEGVSAPTLHRYSSSSSSSSTPPSVMSDEAGAIAEAATRLGVPVPSLSSSTRHTGEGKGQGHQLQHAHPAGVEVRAEASRIRLSLRAGGVKLRGPSVPALHASSVQLQLDLSVRVCAVYQRTGRGSQGRPRGPGDWRVVESDAEERQIREDTRLTWPEAEAETETETEGSKQQEGAGTADRNRNRGRGGLPIHQLPRAFVFELHALHKRIDAAISVPSSILRSMIRAVLPRVLRNLLGKALLPEVGEVLCGGQWGRGISRARTPPVSPPNGRSGHMKGSSSSQPSEGKPPIQPRSQPRSRQRSLTHQLAESMGGAATEESRRDLQRRVAAARPVQQACPPIAVSLTLRPRIASIPLAAMDVALDAGAAPGTAMAGAGRGAALEHAWGRERDIPVGASDLSGDGRSSSGGSAHAAAARSGGAGAGLHISSIVPGTGGDTSRSHGGQTTPGVDTQVRRTKTSLSAFMQGMKGGGKSTIGTPSGGSQNNDTNPSATDAANGTSGAGAGAGADDDDDAGSPVLRISRAARAAALRRPVQETDSTALQRTGGMLPLPRATGSPSGALTERSFTDASSMAESVFGVDEIPATRARKASILLVPRVRGARATTGPRGVAIQLQPGGSDTCKQGNNASEDNEDEEEDSPWTRPLPRQLPPLDAAVALPALLQQRRIAAGMELQRLEDGAELPPVKMLLQSGGDRELAARVARQFGGLTMAQAGCWVAAQSRANGIPEAGAPAAAEARVESIWQIVEYAFRLIVGPRLAGMDRLDQPGEKLGGPVDPTGASSVDGTTGRLPATQHGYSGPASIEFPAPADEGAVARLLRAWQRLIDVRASDATAIAALSAHMVAAGGGAEIGSDGSRIDPPPSRLAIVVANPGSPPEVLVANARALPAAVDVAGLFRRSLELAALPVRADVRVLQASVAVAMEPLLAAGSELAAAVLAHSARPAKGASGKRKSSRGGGKAGEDEEDEDVKELRALVAQGEQRAALPFIERASKASRPTGGWLASSAAASVASSEYFGSDDESDVDQSVKYGGSVGSHGDEAEPLGIPSGSVPPDGMEAPAGTPLAVRVSLPAPPASKGPRRRSKGMSRAQSVQQLGVGLTGPPRIIPSPPSTPPPVHGTRVAAPSGLTRTASANVLQTETSAESNPVRIGRISPHSVGPLTAGPNSSHAAEGDSQTHLAGPRSTAAMAALVGSALHVGRTGVEIAHGLIQSASIRRIGVGFHGGQGARILGWVQGVAVESAGGVVLPPLPLPSMLGNLPRLLFRMRRVHGGRWAEELRRRQLAMRPRLQSALQMQQVGEEGGNGASGSSQGSAFSERRQQQGRRADSDGAMPAALAGMDLSGGRADASANEVEEGVLAALPAGTSFHLLPIPSDSWDSQGAALGDMAAGSMARRASAWEASSGGRRLMAKGRGSDSGELQLDDDQGEIEGVHSLHSSPKEPGGSKTAASSFFEIRMEAPMTNTLRSQWMRSANQALRQAEKNARHYTRKEPAVSPGRRAAVDKDEDARVSMAQAAGAMDDVRLARFAASPASRCETPLYADWSDALGAALASGEQGGVPALALEKITRALRRRRALDVQPELWLATAMLLRIFAVDVHLVREGQPRVGGRAGATGGHAFEAGDDNPDDQERMTDRVTQAVLAAMKEQPQSSKGGGAGTEAGVGGDDRDGTDVAVSLEQRVKLAVSQALMEAGGEGERGRMSRDRDQDHGEPLLLKVRLGPGQPGEAMEGLPPAMQTLLGLLRLDGGQEVLDPRLEASMGGGVRARVRAERAEFSVQLGVVLHLLAKALRSHMPLPAALPGLAPGSHLLVPRSTATNGKRLGDPTKARGGAGGGRTAASDVLDGDAPKLVTAMNGPQTLADALENPPVDLVANLRSGRVRLRASLGLALASVRLPASVCGGRGMKGERGASVAGGESLQWGGQGSRDEGGRVFLLLLRVGGSSGVSGSEGYQREDADGGESSTGSMQSPEWDDLDWAVGSGAGHGLGDQDSLGLRGMGLDLHVEATVLDVLERMGALGSRDTTHPLVEGGASGLQ